MFKKANMLTGNTTPNVEISAGVRPAQHYVVASYLPKVRLDKKTGEYKVISAGKVIATDNSNFVVPAGLAIDAEVAAAGTFANKAAFITGKANFKNLYTAIDVAEGVKNAQGEDVVVDEPVVASFFTDYDSSKTAIVTVGDALGIAPYDVWSQDGAGYTNNPNNYTYNNFKMQTGLSVLTRYFIELPVVANTSGVKFPGLVVFTGTPKNGQMVTYDAESNFVPFTGVADIDTSDTYADAEINAALASINKGFSRILGKVYFIDTEFPKDYLEFVRTWKPSNVEGIDVTQTAPGSATSGLPDNLTFAGVSNPASAKLVRINLVV